MLSTNNIPGINGKNKAKVLSSNLGFIHKWM